MTRHIRNAASGMRSTLFLSALGCLLAAGLAGAVFRPASASYEASTRNGARPGAAPHNDAPQVQEAPAVAPASKAQGQLHGAPLEGGSVLELLDGQISCRASTEDEARAMRRGPGQQLRVIGDEAFTRNPPEETRKGLKIILRGTPQLEQFPDAKAAFLRAAGAWESLIQNPVTVVIDVDFGPTAFGIAFRENQLGNTRFQRDFDPNAYPIIRTALIRSAGSPQEAALLNSLPKEQLPTDVGAATGMIYHVAAMRALGLFPPVADPDAERETLGAPPAIAFNSAISFDFDPSDGVKPKRVDFTGVAMHEIGHALGFFSGVGINEKVPELPPTPDALDLFRFRPGVTSATFTAAQRILSSGGEHIFFGGGPELPLSTGRDDYTGGDGMQAGHWKDVVFAGRYIGIMNPRVGYATRYEITANDLQAFELIGYRMNPLPDPREAELKLDDGTVDNGAVNDGLIVVNRLTPPAYPATLRKLRILIPAFKNQPDPMGKPITLLISAQGASNGQLPPGAQFTRIETTVPSASLDLFLEFTIPDGPTISSGDFYVGYQAPSPSQGVGFAVDLSGSAENRSFYSTDNGASFAPLSEVYQGKAANAMIRAIVSIPGPTPTPTPVPTPTPTPGPATVALTSGVPQNGYMAKSSPRGVSFETQYTIQIPSGATRLKIDLNANTDLDLFARFGIRVAVQDGDMVADFRSESDNYGESITITPASSPSLQAGLYYIMFVNYGPGPSTFTITATVSGGQSCAYSISPASRSFEASGGGGSVKLTTAPGCKWAIKSNVNWIVAEPEPGTSDDKSGFVSYAVAVNNSASSRDGAVTIGDQTFTVTQAGKSDGGGGATEILSVDDGIARGVFADNGAIFVNRLTPSLYPATLRTVRIYFYRTDGKPSAAGAQIRLIIFAGPAGTQRPPDNPSPLLSQTVTVPELAIGGQFVDFPVENGPTINAGDFYVGYQAPNPYGGVGGWFDISSMNNLRSFLSIDNGATYWGPVPPQPGGGSNLMIRAIVSSGAAVRSVVSVSAASFNREALAREEIVAAFGAGMSTGVQVGTDIDPYTPGVQLPTTMLGTTVKVADSAGNERSAPLFFVSPSQINYLMPPDTAVGTATVTVKSGDGTVSVGTAQIAPVAPGLFTASGDGQGAPAAVAMLYNANGALLSVEEVAQLDQSQQRFVPRPLNLGEATDQVFLILYGTGLRHRQSLSTVSARIGGVNAPVPFAGKQSDFAGLDQINVLLPRSLIGRGELDVELMVDGITANKVRINIK